MNGTINGAMNEAVARGERLQAFWSAHGKTVLVAMIAASLAAFGYVVVSWRVFESRASRLLVVMDQMEKPVPPGEPSKEGGEKAPARPDNAAVPSASPQAKANDKFALLEKRALFGEPKAVVPQPRVEAIFGDAALVNGQWLASGGKTGDHTVVAIEIDKVTMTDAEGNRRDFALASGEGGGGGPGGGEPAMSGKMQGLAGMLAGDFAKDGAADKFSALAAKFPGTPKSVFDMIGLHAPDAAVKKIKWDSARGIFDVETKTSDGRDIDMKLGNDGSLRVKDEEIQLASLPPKVHAAVQGRLAEGGKLADLKRFVRDGETYYEAEIKSGSGTAKMELMANGNPRNRN